MPHLSRPFACTLSSVAAWPGHQAAIAIAAASKRAAASVLELMHISGFGHGLAGRFRAAGRS